MDPKARTGGAPALTFAASWFGKASVRGGELLRLSDDQPFDWRFPVEMKPLLGHPKVLTLPEEKYRFLCVQSFYKYLHDVCLTETDVVNRVSTAIAYGATVCQFPKESAAEAFSVLIDEAYHSYAARLFALEIERVTGIAPVALPSVNQLVLGMADATACATAEFSKIAEFLSCCISESTFTKEILRASRLESYDVRFRNLMLEHLNDEGRHYAYFRKLMTYYWRQASERERAVAAAILPALLSRYFDDGVDAEFDRGLLSRIGMCMATRSRSWRPCTARRRFRPKGRD